MGKLAILFLLLPLFNCTSSQSGSTDSATDDGTASPSSSSLPDISTFATTPTDQFLIDETGAAKISRSSPYKGAATSCAHTGAHVHFKNDGAPYTVNIYAVADGTVDRVDTCFDNGDNDRYGITLAIARSGESDVLFDYSIEPMGGKLCTNGADSNFFTSYIAVTEGQSVHKGDIIAQFYKSDTGDDAAHIHFDLKVGNSFACPNIFDASIVTSFASYFTETCSDSPFPETFCYQPSGDEDLTGL